MTGGDGVDPRWRHHDMWAVKGHYFTAYYNWPYTFGLLFGIGLYAEFQRDPERFRAGYDDLLSATGLGDAATLAARFGIDVADTAFWASSRSFGATCASAAMARPAASPTPGWRRARSWRQRTETGSTTATAWPRPRPSGSSRPGSTAPWTRSPPAPARSRWSSPMAMR